MVRAGAAVINIFSNDSLVVEPSQTTCAGSGKTTAELQKEIKFLKGRVEVHIFTMTMCKATSTVYPNHMVDSV